MNLTTYKGGHYRYGPRLDSSEEVNRAGASTGTIRSGIVILTGLVNIETRL